MTLRDCPKCHRTLSTADTVKVARHSYSLGGVLYVKCKVCQLTLAVFARGRKST
ncbi:MAG: hypothetical protein AB7G93_09410 [Bdellovibrionales bacterium]